MPLQYDPPERCLLVQAAIWFEGGPLPMPDDVFVSAPATIRSDSAQLRELFLALKLHDCRLKGNLSVEFQYLDVTDYDGAFMRRQRMGHPCAPPLLMSKNRAIDEIHLSLNAIDFAKNSLAVEPSCLDISELDTIAYHEKQYAARGTVEVYADFLNITVDFEKLQQALDKGDSPQSKQQSKIAGQTKCQNWLLGLMMEGGEPKGKKNNYFLEAKAKFNVSRRGFDRAWSNAIDESGNARWSTAGRKKS